MAEMMEENYLEATSEIRRGKGTVVIWSLKGWKENHALLRHSSYLVDVVGDSASGGGGDAKARAQLRFYFEDHSTCVQQYDNATGRNNSVNMKWLALAVDEVFKSKKGVAILQYDIRVDFVDDKGKILGDHANPVKTTIDVQKRKEGETKPILSQKTFLSMEKTVTDYRGVPVPQPGTVPHPEDLRLKITVIPIYIAVSSSHPADGAKKEEEKKTSLCKALKEMLASDETYNDLRLEMKDGLTLSGHKFILAARSPVLRDLIEREAKKKDWNGTIHLKQLNAKPMIVILHWMYTGELHENAGKCMEELVDAAIHFELTDMIKVPDKKVIGISNPENMFQLYRTAKKNGMVTAEADISKFIKENV